MLKNLAPWRVYETVQIGRNPGSADTYLRNVQQFIDYLISENRSTDPASVSQHDIDDYLKALYFRYNCKKNSTRAQKLSSLRCFFEFLRYAGIVQKNPCALIRSPRLTQRLPRIFSTDELALIFSACDGSPMGLRDLALLKTIYASGIRKEEASNLSMEDISDRGGYVRLKVKGKGYKERMVTLRNNPSKTLRLWMAYRASIQTDHTALFIALKKGRSVHERLSPRHITNILKKYAVLGGLPSADAFVHKLRATWATNLYDSGRDFCPHCRKAIEKVDLIEICLLAGWKSPNTAMKYVAVSERILNKTAIPDRRFNEIEKLIEKFKGGDDEGTDSRP